MVLIFQDMITVPIERDALLTHRAYYIEVALSGHVVVATRSGRVTWITPDFAVGATYTFFEDQIDDLSISPDGLRLAVHAERRLHHVDARTGKALHSEWVQHGGTSRFANDGALWTFEGATLARREAVTLAPVCTATVADPIPGGSLWSIQRHPDPTQVALWAAGGPDGQAIFWAKDDGATLTVRRLPNVEECAPPVVRRDGAEYLVLSGDRLLRIAHGRDEILAERDEWTGPGGDAVEHLEVVVYAGDRHAIVSTGEGLLYLVNLDTMRITDGVAPTGHAPRPIEQLYPSLTDATGLASTLQFFLPYDDRRILSVHRELPDANYDEEDESDDDGSWRDRLLCWTAPQVR